MDRRQFLLITGIMGLGSIAGCSSSNDGGQIKDSDSDGMIDSKDYAPSDPAVQEKSDLNSHSNSQQTTQETDQDQTSQPSAELNSFNRSPLEGYQADIVANIGSADRIDVVYNGNSLDGKQVAKKGEVLATITATGQQHVIYAPSDSLNNGPLHAGDEVIAVAVNNGEKEQIAKQTIV